MMSSGRQARRGGHRRVIYDGIIVIVFGYFKATVTWACHRIIPRERLAYASLCEGARRRHRVCHVDRERPVRRNRTAGHVLLGREEAVMTMTLGRPVRPVRDIRWEPSLGAWPEGSGTRFRV